MGIENSILEGAMLEKAVIEVVDMHGIELRQKLKAVSAKNGKGTDEEVALKKELAKYKKLEADALLNKSAALASALDATGSVSGGVHSGVTTSVQNAVARRFTVQFNPSSLSFNATGGGIIRRNEFGSGSGGMSYGTAKTHIEFGVQIIFDNMVRSRAFLGDGFSINADNAIDAVAESVVGATGLGGPSVQERVEAFQALVRNKYTKNITFAWGSLMYSGVVTGCDATYTMFNPTGEPVRAVVQLNMICVDATVAPGQLGFWADKYKEAFESGNTSYADRMFR